MLCFSSSLSSQPIIVESSLASLNSQMPTSRNLWLVSISVFSHFSFRFNLGHTSCLGMEVETGTVWTCGSSVALPSASLCGSYPFGLSVLFGTLSFMTGSLSDICMVSWASLWLCLVHQQVSVFQLHRVGTHCPPSLALSLVCVLL